MRTKFSVALGLFLLLSGCVTVSQPPTASGKPEVTIPNSSPEKVKPALVNQMVNGGFRITKDTPYELTFDKPVENIAVAVLMGSKYDSQPNVRVSYTFAQLSGSTRVVADVAIITNPGSAFERRTAINAGVDSYDIQVFLDRVRGELDPTSPIAVAQQNKIILGVSVMSAARAKAAGQTGPENGLYVVLVTPGSIAERTGLVKGDVITSFAGRPTNELTELAAAQAATKPGSTVKVGLWRQGGEEEISISFPAPEKKDTGQRPRKSAKPSS